MSIDKLMRKINKVLADYTDKENRSAIARLEASKEKIKAILDNESGAFLSHQLKTIRAKAHVEGQKSVQDPVQDERVTKLVEALNFYADPRKYKGPNQEAEPDEEKREGLFRLDVTWDQGEKAREALRQFSKGDK